MIILLFSYLLKFCVRMCQLNPIMALKFLFLYDFTFKFLLVQPKNASGIPHPNFNGHHKQLITFLFFYFSRINHLVNRYSTNLCFSSSYIWTTGPPNSGGSFSILSEIENYHMKLYLIMCHLEVFIKQYELSASIIEFDGANNI